jgi:NADPH:quinone reductase-like Zn-dependent oxidoreductase
MKTWRIEGLGIGALAMAEEDIAPPAPGEVQVRILSAAINARDIGIAEGLYSATPGIIPLSDGAGAVIAVGDGVTSFSVGDAVVTCFYEDWPSGRGTLANHARSLGRERDGVLAEAINLPASALAPSPVSLRPDEAATLTCAGLTAWSALFTEAHLRPGQHVVVQGTGGVALFALQFAKMGGATVTVISASDAKLERAQALGADHTVNYRAIPEWGAAVRDFTGGEGADAVIELGGTQTLGQSLDCLRMDGTIALVGMLSGLEASFFIPLALDRRVRLHGITVGHREDFLEMARAIDARGIKPVIDRTYTFMDARQAYEDLPKGNHFGKLIIDVAS